MDEGPLKYEVSMIYEGYRRPTWLLLPPDKIDYLEDLMSTACAHAMGGNITGLSFIQLSDDPATDIDELIKTISGNVDDEVDWTHVQYLVKKVKKEAQDNPQARKICVEFIWNIGGDDDNIFTDSFEGVPGGVATQEFIDALEEMGSTTDEYFDFTTYDPQVGHSQDVGIAELIRMANDAGELEVCEFFSALRSLDLRVRLSDVATSSAPLATKLKF